MEFHLMVEHFFLSGKNEIEGHKSPLLLDIFISSIVGALQGAAIGWSLGKF